MFKLQAAKAGLIVSVVFSGVHYGANGIVEMEKIVERRYEKAKGEVINKAAARLGYAPVLPEKHWREIAAEQAEENGLNKCLVEAVITVESGGKATAMSKAGALGLMQLMPATARGFCGIAEHERLDPEKNIRCGIKLLKRNILDHGLYRGLQVYNAGPSRVGKTQENVQYPHKVLAEWYQCNI